MIEIIVAVGLTIWFISTIVKHKKCMREIQKEKEQIEKLLRDCYDSKRKEELKKTSKDNIYLTR